jgi:hypothetical protein
MRAKLWRVCALGFLLASPAFAAGGSLSDFHAGYGSPGPSTGGEGDFFLDVSTGNVFGPKTSLAWPAGSGLIIAFPRTISGGVSGGIPCFTSTTVEDVSALLAANALVIGHGAAACPGTTTTGTGVITAAGIPVNTDGGLVTGSTLSIVSGSLLTGGGSGTAISGFPPGSGVASALAIAANTAGSFPTTSATSIVAGNILVGGGSGVAITGIVPGSGVAAALASNTNAASAFVGLDSNAQARFISTIASTAGKPTPTASGSTCAAAGATAGGANAGTFALSGICAVADILTLTWAAAQAAPTGWACTAYDRSLAASKINQITTSTTTAEFAVAVSDTGAADVIQYQCIAY